MSVRVTQVHDSMRVQDVATKEFAREAAKKKKNDLQLSRAEMNVVVDRNDVQP